MALIKFNSTVIYYCEQHNTTANNIHQDNNKSKMEQTMMKEWRKHMTPNDICLISQHYNDEEVTYILQIYGDGMLGVLRTLFSPCMTQHGLSAHFSDVPTEATGK